MKMFVGQLKLNKISLLAGLGLSAILFAHTAHANTPKTFAKQEQADLMAKGMWYDERTGLIWDRCYLGETWNGFTCIGSHTSYTIETAKTAILKHRLGDYKDWQIPTIAELQTIVKCKDGYKHTINTPIHHNKYAEIFHECIDQPVNGISKMDTGVFKSNRVGFWHLSSTLTSSNNYYTVSFWSGIIGTHRENNYAVRPVRTAHKISDIDFINLLTSEVTARQAAKAEKARKEQEAYDKKVANFRKNLKAGDDATAGMVIEIKGDLVKIQTNDSQCSQRDHKGNCSNWINTPVEKWVKRRELYPAN